MLYEVITPRALPDAGDGAGVRAGAAGGRRRVSGDPDAPPPALPGGNIWPKERYPPFAIVTEGSHVITSYSIHYTKLYE